MASWSAERSSRRNAAIRTAISYLLPDKRGSCVASRDPSGSNVEFRSAGIMSVLAALVLGLSGCATGAGAAAGSPTRDWLQTDLYFAIGRVGDSAAGETVWRRFTAAEVIPRFPDGFTIVPAVGTWRADATGSAPELDSRVLVILHPRSREADQRIEAIRSAWRAITGDESVLRSDHAARVSF
jgi:hypothetical protein